MTTRTRGSKARDANWNQPVWGRLPVTGVRCRGAHSAIVVVVHREMVGGDGGADRDRTDDLRLAKPALSQLSYSPKQEPSRLFALPGTAAEKWWAWEDSNFRPPAYQADALTN